MLPARVILGGPLHPQVHSDRRRRHAEAGTRTIPRLGGLACSATAWRGVAVAVLIGLGSSVLPGVRRGIRHTRPFRTVARARTLEGLLAAGTRNPTAGSGAR